MSNTIDFSKAVIEKDALKKLIELIFEELEATVLKTSDTIPGLAAEANSSAYKNKVPTVLAVFNAMASIDHIKLKFVKSTDGKSFEEMMKGKTPSEVTFYVFKDSPTDKNFDLYLYDSQQGQYINIGLSSLTAGDLDLSNFYNKDEFNISDYIKRDELEEMLANKGSLDEAILVKYLKKDDAEKIYIRRDELHTLVAKEVEAIFNEVKNGSGSSSGGSTTDPDDGDNNGGTTTPSEPDPIPESTVVQVGGKNYDSLEEAISDATSESSFKLVNDYTLSNKLNVDRELSLDLGGKTLTCDGANYLAAANGATLTISNGKVTNINERALQASENATIVLSDDTVVESSHTYGVVLSGGNLTVDSDSEIKNPSSYAIYASNDSNITIAGGKVVADKTVAVVLNGSKLTVESGSVVSNAGNAIQAQKNSKVTIKSGTITAKTAKAYAVKALSGSTLDIEGGNISGEEGAVYVSDTSNAKPSVNISGGTISAESYGIVIWDDVILNISKDASIEAAYAVSTNGSADPSNQGVVINVNGGNLTGTDAGVYLPAGTLTIDGDSTNIEGPAGIVVRGGTLVIKNGNITATGTGESTYGDAKYNLQRAGIVIDKNDKYNSGHVDVTINGGTITGNPALRYTEDGVEKTTSENIHIKGGSFSDNSADTFKEN